MPDEPTEGIRPLIREEIVEARLMLRDRLRLTMLLVGQNEAFPGALCTRSYRPEPGGEKCGDGQGYRQSGGL